ncbi:YafY family protein [uncultured Acetobacterium sp.]|uniref:helix-turn-helix transcriptional regulator n=1 Tax=uncultured Acetobacterium sp. TaxID=217139 RepID=UPI0025FC765D|nr:YafY family protein [uncultured Acetobacterium sp.]
MKIDRLIGILSILLQQKKVTAPYLAEIFEVSRRTINRDIENICKAGIPLTTSQGANGGIAIMEGYKIDKTLLSSAELQSILAGLKSLDSVAGTNQYRQLIDKLAVSGGATQPDNHIVIDLSSHYKNSLAPKFEIIKKAIDQRRLITFYYYSPKGESSRQIEPYLMVYQWSSWYIWGYCQDRCDFRHFKLNRLWDLQVREETYKPRDLPKYNSQEQLAMPSQIHLVAEFDPIMKWRLIDEYGLDCYQMTQEGKLRFEFYFASQENLFSWLLSFGDGVELIKPEALRKDFLMIAKKLVKKYQ